MEADTARGLLFEHIKSSVTMPTHQYTERSAIDPIILSQPSWSWVSIPLDSSSAISYEAVFRPDFQVHPQFKVILASSICLGVNPFNWAAECFMCVRGDIT
jgi:hypothetical protein